MSELGRVQANVKIMLDAKAPEAEIDSYLKIEGITPDQLRSLNEQGAAQFGAPPKMGVNFANTSMTSPQLPQQIEGQIIFDPSRQAALDTSPGQAALIAAGRTSTKIVEGVKDLALTPSAFAGNQESIDARQQIAVDQAEGDRLYKPLSDEHPKSTFLGEMGPYIAAPIRLPGIPQAVSNMLIPGAMGFAEYGKPQERLQKAAAGVGAGILGNVATRIIGGRATPQSMDPYLSETIRRGKELGFIVRPSVIRGDKTMQAKEAVMETSSRTADIAGDIGEQNTRQITRIAARSIGLDNVDRLTPDQLNAAKRAIGRQFEEAGTGHTIKLDTKMWAEIDDIVAQYSEGAGRRSNKIQNIAEDLRERFGKSMTPEQYRRQISTLATDARSAANLDSGKSKAMYDIREALDQAFDRSTSRPPPIDAISKRFSPELRKTLNDFGGQKKQLAAFREARNKWRALLMLEDAVTEMGDISYLKLANKARRSDKSGYVYGNRESELYDALRFLKTFPKQFGNPGTAQRLGKSLLSDVRDTAIPGAAIGGLFGGTSGAFIGGSLGAGVGLLTPIQQKMAARLYYSDALNRGLWPMAERTQGLLSAGITKALTPALRSIPQFE